MNDKQILVDTNILVYAHDGDAGEKHIAARRRLEELWTRMVPPAVSVQVLQELYVNLVRKGASNPAARRVVEDFMRRNVVTNGPAVLNEGMRLADRFGLSLWDALIVAAARRAGAGVVWSEDLNAGQEYDGVKVENPLK